MNEMSLFGRMIGRLNGRLDDRLGGRLGGSLGGSLGGRLNGRLNGRLGGRLNGILNRILSTHCSSRMMKNAISGMNHKFLFTFQRSENCSLTKLSVDLGILVIITLATKYLVAGVSVASMPRSALNLVRL